MPISPQMQIRRSKSLLIPKYRVSITQSLVWGIIRGAMQILRSILIIQIILIVGFIIFIIISAGVDGRIILQVCSTGGPSFTHYFGGLDLFIAGYLSSPYFI